MATEPWCHAASPWESICIRMSNHDCRHRDDQSRSWEQYADSVPLHFWQENGSGLCARCGHARGTKHLIGHPDVRDGGG